MCNAKIKNVQDKMPDITNLATNTTLHAKLNKFKNKISSTTKLATTTAINAQYMILKIKFLISLI